MAEKEFTMPSDTLGYVIEGGTCTVTKMIYMVKVNYASLTRWRNGEVATLEEAFPELTPEQREFVARGITPAEWKEIFQPGRG